MVSDYKIDSDKIKMYFDELREEGHWIKLWFLQILLMLGLTILGVIVTVFVLYKFTLATIKLPFRVIKSLWNKYVK